MMSALTQSPAVTPLTPIFPGPGVQGSIGGDKPSFDQLVAGTPLASDPTYRSALQAATPSAKGGIPTAVPLATIELPVGAAGAPLAAALPAAPQTTPGGHAKPSATNTSRPPLMDDTAAPQEMPTSTPKPAAPQAAESDREKTSAPAVAADHGETSPMPVADAPVAAAADTPAPAKSGTPADTALATSAGEAGVLRTAFKALDRARPVVVAPNPTAAVKMIVGEGEVPPFAADAGSRAAAPLVAPKPGKVAEALVATLDGKLPVHPAVAKAHDTAQPSLAAADVAPAKAKIVDAGPSMTVAFTQPAAPAAGAIAEAATAAPVAERVLDLTSDDAWIEQLARDIATTKSQSGDISFRLMPRHFGRLDVAMRQEEGGVSLKLDTQHEATATVVHAAQGRLVEDLRQQGVRVAGAEVTCTPGETGRQSQSQQGQGRGAAHDTAHLIETAPERAEARDEERAADRGGRFA